MNTNAAVEDMNTAFRLELSVADLEHLASIGGETPVSGDALAIYGRRQGLR